MNVYNIPIRNKDLIDLVTKCSSDIAKSDKKAIQEQFSNRINILINRKENSQQIISEWKTVTYSFQEKDGPYMKIDACKQTIIGSKKEVKYLLVVDKIPSEECF